MKTNIVKLLDLVSPKAVFGCNGAFSDGGEVLPLISSAAVITSTFNQRDIG